jgi:hypothetical protein
MKGKIMQDQDEIIIVFSGFNQRAVIAFLRTIEKTGLTYAIIAKSENDTIFDTNYNLKVYATRKQQQLDIDDLLSSIEIIKIKTRKSKCFVVPSTEALNRFLLTNRALFEQSGVRIPLVDKLLYEQISDKYTFCRLCENYDITIPSEDKDIYNIKIPFVAKPISYFNKAQETFVPQLIYTERDRKIFIEKHNLYDFYYQQFIDGRSYYLLYYFDKEGNVYKYSQENVAQQPNGKSIVAATSSTIHQIEISDKYEFMFRSIGFRGLVMVEIKEEEGIFYMIEANPRFWGPSQLFVDANVNFFQAFLYDNEIIRNEPDFLHPIVSKYFWFGGMIEYEKKNMPIVYHTKGYSIHNNINEWLSFDIYKRDDTIEIFEKENNMGIKDELINLYAKNSKHSNYQILSRRLSGIIGDNIIEVRTRYESERLNYILSNILVKDKSILDIGGNSGFFSFELIDAGAKHVLYYEGNKVHANFVELAADALNVNDRIKVVDKYFSFEHELDGEKTEITLLLNVLHHIGDDYGNNDISLLNAKSEILKQLNSLADKTSILVFQLGFNWKGNRNIGLFENGAKTELIEFIEKGTCENWEIEKIGIAEKMENRVQYKDLNEKNSKRDDSLGEFLNRPLFIMKSKK